MEKEKKVLVPKEVKQETTDLSVESFIRQAIETKVPIDTLERLLVMRDKVKAERAKEAFDTSMAEFQVSCPTIKKKKMFPQKQEKQHIVMLL